MADDSNVKPQQAVSPVPFRQALGQFPTGVTVVTAMNGTHP
ncbi:MAG: hypothetical protein JWP84_4700, partial [Tardiphaga sp.]|nr:hypothetical protein [Tardiphaga sp.]